VFYEEELYSRWCHGLFASGAALIIASISSPLLIHYFNPVLGVAVMVCAFCVVTAVILLYCSAMVAYHYNPERIFNEDWSRLSSSLDNRPDLEDGPRSLAKQIRVRLQYLENEEIRIQSEYFKLYGKSESSPKNGEELKPMFERSLYEIRCLQVAQIMFTPKVHKIS
jgi:predicted outer membrane lipoprotein